MICYFSSKTGNTKRFVEKLNLPLLRIENSKKLLTVDKPFVLFVATYANGEGKNALPRHVIDFIKENKKYMKGVVSSGNKNFGKLFAISGDIVARNCEIPLLYKYELFGTPSDVIRVQNILKEVL